MMVKAIMHGCNGKMGQVITGLIKNDDMIEIVAGIDKYQGIQNDYPVFGSLKECNIDPVAESQKAYKPETIEKLADLYKNLSCQVTETNPFTNAQVCAGGVDTADIMPETMESKVVKGLYFAGELVDVDGTCGGYNLQWAWSSGYVAGLYAASRK